MPSRKRGQTGHNFIVQGGILAIAGIITRIIGLFYRIPVTNIIGDEGNGYYAAAYQIYNIMLLISSYSLPLALSKIVSARYSRKEYHNAERVFKGGLIFAVITGGIVCLLVYFGADFFAARMMSEPMSAIALRIFAPTLLIVAIMGVVRGYFQGMGTMVPTAISQIIEQIINAVVSILAAQSLFSYGTKVARLLKNDHYAPAYGAAGSTLGTSTGALAGLSFLILALLMVSTSLKRFRKKEEPHPVEEMPSIMKLIIITAVPVILSTAIYNVSDVLDNGIFNHIMSMKGQDTTKTAIWGVYSGKYRLLINVPIALSNAMCSSVVPTLTACMAVDDHRSARRKIYNAMRFTMLIAFPCTVGLGVLAEPILSMLFHGDVTLAASLLRVGCITIIFTSISTLTNGILQGINHLETPVRHSAIALVIHLGVLYVMLNTLDMGIYGVVYANMIFAFLMCIMNQHSIRRFIRYRQEFGKTFIIPGISSIIMGVVVYSFFRIFTMFAGNMVSTFIAIFMGICIYFICILRLGGIRREEIYDMPGGRFFARFAEMMHLI
ncbi:MAG: polysaccharide biosynthesis protein [Lachnospiraceae bacterium]|nr:polysaccharide biosynthesis protein [Lachnospiraceae bacterium]